jgi:hypothetical protein
MAINAAQASATKKSRATQAASSTTRIAIAVRVTARVRESKGSTGFPTGRGSPPSWLGMNAEWRNIRGQILMAAISLRAAFVACDAPIYWAGSRASRAINAYRLDDHQRVLRRSEV